MCFLLNKAQMIAIKLEKFLGKSRIVHKYYGLGNLMNKRDLER